VRLVVGNGEGVGRARYYPGAQVMKVKLLAEPGSGRLLGGQLVGGEGVKERADFLAFALKKGATLEDIAWMENVYSPPIGALYEPMSVAAQNALAQLCARTRTSPSRSASTSARTGGRSWAPAACPPLRPRRPARPPGGRGRPRWRTPSRAWARLGRGSATTRPHARPSRGSAG